MSIIQVISINQYTLAVFYTSSDCYKYSIIDEYGVLLEPDEIFYTCEAAEREGREALKDSLKGTPSDKLRVTINTVFS